MLIDFVTTLARLLTRHGNRVGAMFYGSRVEHTIPARGGRVQVLRLVHDLLRPAAPGAAPFTDLGAAARGRAALRSSGARSSFVDLGLHQRAGLGDGARACSTRRHEVLAVRLYDPRESELPDVGPMIMEDAETGEQLVRRHPRQGVPAAVRRRPRERREAELDGGVPAGRGRRRRRSSTDEDLSGAIVRMATLGGGGRA